MEIRKAKLKEVSQVADLGVEMIKYHHKLDTYESPSKNIKQVYKDYLKKTIYSSTKILLVAVDGGKVVGYALSSTRLRPPVFKDRKMGFIDDIFFIEKYRGKNFAGIFLKMLFKWFKEKGIHNIELTVHDKNELAKKAWKKYGFETYLYRLKKRI